MDIGDSVQRAFTVFFAWIPALIAAIALGSALAFGLGGRAVAKDDRTATRPLATTPSASPNDAGSTS